jgi:sugar lactone lactonase YvrE
MRSLPRARAHGATLLAGLALLAACGQPDDKVAAGGADMVMDSVAKLDSAGGGGRAGGASRVASIAGFKTPESVKYDADQDVYFVSNINGNPSAKDNNGFISRVRGDGSAVDSMMFIAGGRGGVRLNGPKGMAIVGDTLVVADIDAVRMFNRKTGAPVASVDFAPLRANFLNDVAVGGDGALYITDTGIRFSPNGQMSHPGPDRVFKLTRRTPSVAIADSALSGPNGIAWDSAGARFVIAAFNGKALLTWKPGGRPTSLAEGPGQFDGVEVLQDGRVIASSWADSSVHVARNGSMTKLASGLPSPADIGVNARGGIVAVPLFMENRVEFWSLGK